MTGKEQFTTLDTGLDYSVRDNITGECLFEQNITDKLNELSSELAIYKSKYLALKEDQFTKMGGFSYVRDGRGRYYIHSENVIPKSSAVISITSPAGHWNRIVKNMIMDILSEKGVED